MRGFQESINRWMTDHETPLLQIQICGGILLVLLVVVLFRKAIESIQRLSLLLRLLPYSCLVRVLLVLAFRLCAVAK